MVDEFEQYLAQEPRDEFEQYLSPEQSNEPQNKSFRDHLLQLNDSDAIKNFNSALQRTAGAGVGGVFQTIGDTGASLGNLAISPFTEKRIPHPDLRQYLPQDSLANASFLGGEIAGAFLPGGPIGLASKLNKFSRPSGYMGLLTDALKGAGIGYATGERENDYGELGGREVGAALGSGANVIGQALPSAIGKRVLKNKANVEKKYEKAYTSLFDEAKAKGIKDVGRLKEVDIDLIKSQSADFGKALSKFQKAPTLENAHIAQSDLGKFTRSLEKKINELPSEKQAAYRAAKEAQKQLRKAIMESTEKSGHPELGRKYIDLTHGYRKDVIPYRNEAIRKTEAGDIAPRYLPSALHRDKEFITALGNKYPELFLSGRGAKIAGGIAGGGLLGGSIWEHLSNELKR
jgi:hypothetical protein